MATTATSDTSNTIITYFPIHIHVSDDSTATWYDRKHLTSSYTVRNNCSNSYYELYDKLIPEDSIVKHIPFFFHFYRNRKNFRPLFSFFITKGSNNFNRKVLRCNRKGIGLRIKQSN